MKITAEPLENRQLSLTIEVDEQRTEQAMQRAAHRIAKEVNIPGFRKGRAPYDVIVQRFGEDTIRREAADLIADEVYAEALEQEGIEPYASGMLEDMQFDPISYKLTVPLAPEVMLGDYRSYRREFASVEVSNEQVEQALAHLQEEHAFFEPVDRPAALGDGVAFNLTALAADGSEIMKGEDIRLILEAGSTDPAPGFVEQVVGMSVDEERTFTLTLTADFPREEYRGQEAAFTVKVTEVYNYILPALDDDLARTVGNYDSFQALEQAVRDGLHSAAVSQAEREYAEQVVSDLVEQAQIAHPSVMLERELDDLVQETEQSVRREARMSLEDYLRIQGTTQEQLREELTPRAESRLRRGLVLNEIVKLEGLEADDKEIAAEIEQVSAPWGSRAEQVRASLESDQGRQAMRSRILASKAVQRLVTIAKGELEQSLSETAPEEPAAEAEEAS